jgi:carbon storage regulator CsrA|tara:strand:- start:1757 stop:1942 length:186 start_codon:yes stop_codon:yes gene_type:complete
MTNKNLILTRKKGEKIILQKDGKVLCVVTVTSLSPTQCKLGFQADTTVRIDREEVYTQKEK